MNDRPLSIAAGRRGPADHSVRAQIIEAADKHFSHFGYGKTTVADLAKVIGFSKAYIYKFFDSKQAIGEAICDLYLNHITDIVRDALKNEKTSTGKLQTLLRNIAGETRILLFNDRHLYDLAAYASIEKWPSTQAYAEAVGDMLKTIIAEGRASGEFERKAPVDEAVRAILQAFQPFMNPAMLQYDLDAGHDAANEVINLFLRSLAP